MISKKRVSSIFTYDSSGPVFHLIPNFPQRVKPGNLLSFVFILKSVASSFSRLLLWCEYNVGPNWNIKHKQTLNCLDLDISRPNFGIIQTPMFNCSSNKLKPLYSSTNMGIWMIPKFELLIQVPDSLFIFNIWVRSDTTHIRV